MNAKVDLPQAREVCPTTTRRLLAEGALMVDVRELAEVAQVGFDVPGVLLMPLSELEQRFADLPRDRDLVLVCQVGQRSLKAAYFLMYQGYTRVASMDGGLFKWANKGFPIKGASAASSAQATSSAGGCCGTAAAATASSSCCGSDTGCADAPAGDNACCNTSSAGTSCC
jgi:rhodanese-related sulfurtransferase